ncbi:MAG: B3/B4 domain-containing protein [Anaerolineales bacterium]
MYLRVADPIFSEFPGACLGVVIAHGMNNAGEHAPVLQRLREAEAQTVQAFTGAQISEHPHIAVWREAYRKFGSKPKDYPSSVENLVRRVAKGYVLPHINTLVDIYNAVSLRHVLPVGGEDLDKIKGDVWLTFAGNDEAPVQLLGEIEARAPYAGEVIYTDEAGAICRRWNWKEAERTKFTAATRDAFLVIEGLPPVSGAVVETALRELADAVLFYCGGTVATAWVDADNSKVRLR